MTWTIRPRSEFAGLAAIRAGNGAPVLLLHGVGLRAEAWNAQTDFLAGRYGVVAPDLPGHGESPRLLADPRLSDFTDAVADGLDAPVVVAGHSMGAMIALDLAGRYPALVKGVAALNAVYRRPPEALASVRQRAADLGGTAAADPSDTLRRWFGEAETPEREACGAWLTAADPAGYKAAYTVFARENGPSDALLGGLSCRALFVTGSAEPNSTPAMSEAMAALAPRGRAVVVKGAAHMMPMTHAGEVNRMLAGFFEECEG